jgi:hypothetical protein
MSLNMMESWTLISYIFTDWYGMSDIERVGLRLPLTFPYFASFAQEERQQGFSHLYSIAKKEFKIPPTTALP